MPQPNPAPQVFADSRIGKYEIVQRIAYGGMAEIYLARASGIEGFEKYIVLKRILPQFAANPEFIRMFLREARLAAALDHANIAHVYDIGEENGTFFFTMEYLHGEDVRSIVKSLRERKQRLPLEHAVAIGIGAAAGLHFAHEKKSPDGRALGIVHCDMSPSNIVVTYDGGVKIVDFGVAKITADPDFSRRHSLKGKLAYMAPEQIAGKRIDCRSDLFALGIVLYEITTGRRLFRAESDAEVMHMVLDRVIVPPSKIVADYPTALEHIVMRALNRDPSQRYQRGRDLQKDLEIFARDLGLRLSSAVLAEWMEQTFGPKTEIWHRLPPPAERRPEAQSSSGTDQTAPTRVVAHPAAPGVEPQLQISNSSAAVPPIAITAAPPALAPPRWHRGRSLAVAAAGVAVLGVTGGFFLGLRSPASALADKRGGPPGSTILVVEETGQVALEPSPATVPSAPSASARAAPIEPTLAPAATQSPSPPVAIPPAPASSPSRRQREPRGSRAPSRGDDFSAVLARREGDVRKCFNSADDAALVHGEAWLRFEVAADGLVSSVTVLPASLAATQVGACLAQVGKKTVFPPQTQPVVFRVPVTVEVQRGTRSKR